MNNHPTIMTQIQKYITVRPDLFISSLNSKPFCKNRVVCTPFANFRFYNSQCIALKSNTNTCSNQSEVKLFEKKSLPIQTLSNFPIEKLKGEIVLVRIDSNYLFESSIWNDKTSLEQSLSAIKYLHNANSIVIIATSWTQFENPNFISQQSLSDYLSFLLKIKVVPISFFTNQETEKHSIFLLENLSKFREEFANSPEFSERLAFNASIFINEAFYISHKMLSSTVGVARFCHLSLAGFNFENEYFNLLKLVDSATQPYFAIIGGNNFLKKARALQVLASKCDGLIFVGKLGFQIMNNLNLLVPERYIEKDSIEEVNKLIQIVKNRKIQIIYPTDFLYLNNNNSSELQETFSSDEILNGLSPIDIGPKTLEKIISSISSCKKILWIGPSNFGLSQKDTFGVSQSQLALALEKSSKNGCEVFIAGSTVSDAFARISMHKSQIKLFKSTTVIWEFLKGRILPGIAALDKAYPYSIDWSKVYSDPALPLIVDIGSGNGLFLFQMAKKMKDSNFLGLEINEMLVNRCLNGVNLSKSKNLHFVSTNANSNFRSIISSYPGDLVLVTIQCPNPDFNREEYRWKMVQRALVESIIDLLIIDGQVFLQSDIEAVTVRMREQFIKYGRGKMVIDKKERMEDGRGKMVIDKKEWMEENPFGVRTDWELHTIARGNPMYRTMLLKIR